MKMRRSSLPMILAMITLFLTFTEIASRKTFLVKMQYPALLAPKVSNYDSSLTIFNINNYHFIIDNQIQVELGWDFIQKQGVQSGQNFRYYTFRNNLYFRQEFVLHPDVELGNIYQGELNIELPKFRSNAFWELKWYPEISGVNFCL